MKLFALFCFCSVYTLVRYSLFGSVPADHWPAFLFNKAISFFAVATLCWSAWLYHQGQLAESKRIGRVVWHAVIIHIGLSMVLISPDYYEKFFAEEGLNLNGELIMLFGVLATYCFWLIPRYYQALTLQHRLKWGACLLALGHIIPMGSSWLTPATWLGGMPPISLLSGLCCLAAFLLSLQRVDDNTQPTEKI